MSSQLIKKISIVYNFYVNFNLHGKNGTVKNPTERRKGDDIAAVAHDG